MSVKTQIKFTRLNMKKNKILIYTREKVWQLFKDYPVPAHGFDHMARVASWAMKIAKVEKADVFLSEMSAWLHDIGRTLEDDQIDFRRHHELSYEMLKVWFREDRTFDALTKKEKIIILYAVRYHWNDVADKYDVAWILRDADKMDSMDVVGVKRSIELCKTSESLQNDFRYKFAMYFCFHTKTAKKIVEKKKMMIPIVNYYKKILKEDIEPISI